MHKLVLAPEYDRIPDLKPALLHELAAAQYLGMCRTKFRGLVKSGLIPFAQHVNGSTRIYLRGDLDAYIESLNWRKIELREVSPVV